MSKEVKMAARRGRAGAGGLQADAGERRAAARRGVKADVRGEARAAARGGSKTATLHEAKTAARGEAKRARLHEAGAAARSEAKTAATGVGGGKNGAGRRAPVVEGEETVRRAKKRTAKRSVEAAGPTPPLPQSAAEAMAKGVRGKEGGCRDGAVDLPEDLRAEFEALPLRQQMFVREYLSNGFNCAQALRAVGYSESSATRHAARFTRNPTIARIVTRQAGRAMARREITAERVLDEMAKVAFFDPRRIFDAKGGLLAPGEIGDEEAAAIAGLDVRQTQDGSELKKIKLADKTKSLEMLGRYLRLFQDRVEHSGAVGVQLIHDVPRPEREGV
ncbi:MAG: terminase small subunit [Acidobacteriaceae bacterium]